MTSRYVKATLLQNRKSLFVMGAGLLCLLSFLYSFVFSQPKLVTDGTCWKGSESTELQRLDDLRTEYKVEEFLEGPGLTVEGDNRAACKIMHENHTTEFPYPLMQVYRCFSWFRANQNKEPYLLISRKPIYNPFLKGVLDSLRNAFGVWIVFDRNDLKVVRGRVSYEHDNKQSFAMRNSQDAADLRKGIMKSLMLSDDICPEEPRISVLDRKESRSMANAGYIIRTLEKTLGSASFKVFTVELRPFEKQVEFFANTDILISPHVPQLAGIPFMPTCSSVLELFPAGYYRPYFFGSLAAVSGVNHSFMYLGNNLKREQRISMMNEEVGEAARSADLCPDEEMISKAVVRLVQEWRDCCQSIKQRN